MNYSFYKSLKALNITFINVLFLTSFLFVAEAVMECNLTVNVRLGKEKGKTTLFINGETNLPDEAKIYLFLKSPTQTIASRKAYVKDGRFSSKIVLLETQKLIPWDYTLEAVLWPSRQKNQKVRELIGLRGEKLTEIAPNLSDIHSETGERIIKATCSLKVGVPEDKERALKELKEELTKELEDINQIYIGIKAKYELYQEEGEDFNLTAWQEYLSDYQPQMIEMLERNSQYQLVSYLPKTRGEIGGLIIEILKLATTYDCEFNGVPLIERNPYETVPPGNLPSVAGAIEKILVDLPDKLNNINRF